MERISSSTSLKIRVPDRDYWKEQVRCQSACPVHTDARGYVRAIAEGREELAYLIARGPNPLASLCGRICGAPCESACRRGDVDEPISIRALKRYVCDQYGPGFNGRDGCSMVEYLQDAARRYAPRECQDQEELLPLLQSVTRGDFQPVTGKSVGIIGSGPAGLAAAHDLALFGFSVTIYELEPVLAGMLTVGVPEYRLPRDLIQQEVDVIRAMGVEAKTNCRVGEDIGFPEIRDRHDAVIVAIGAKKSRHLPIPGADVAGLLGGVEYLREVSLGRPPELGKRVVVIGGGNVAYDVGRTVLRQIAMDAARTAMRDPHVGEVYLCSLESLDEMPADDIEIIEGDEEGIVRRNSLGPTAILTNERGEVTGVRFQRCLRVFDENHRFNPVFDEHDVEEIPCDNVLISIGQAFDVDFINAERDAIRLSDRGGIDCDPETGQTSAPDVFVAGDLAYGPKLMIHAIASGKAVAREIYTQITGTTLRPRDTELHFPLPDYTREEDYEKHERQHPATIPVTERLKGQDRTVETGFTTEEARCEAGRCLDCGINTIFDGSRCILCAGCVDVCPEQCLQIVSVAEIDGEPAIRDVLDAQLDGLPPAEASAIIKDETLCIRCGLCAERCPTGAITMERFLFKEAWQCHRD